jgi:hypothetical protein
MKKNLLILPLLLLLGLAAIEAQITTPAASPGAMVKQTVGLSEVTIEYSRPAMKGRTIFAADGLVPFDAVWRTGANQATKITFSDDVTVGDKALSAGSYAILTKPSAMSWDIHFYAYDGGNWGNYTSKTPDLVATAKPTKIEFPIESFTIGLGNVVGGNASIWMGWENTMVSVPIAFEVESKVMASIDRAMAGPSSNDYFAAASYYHENGKDLNKALEWINLATAGDNPAFWQVRRKALILADLGKKQAAIAAAKMSMELAQKAGNDDYVRMNKKSLKEWGAM